jgi:hypothetical protein
VHELGEAIDSESNV